MDRSSFLRCVIPGLTTLLAIAVHAEEYELQVIAASEDLKTDGVGTQQGFGPAKLNNAGEVLFSGYWRDKDGWQHSTLNLGRPGGVRRIATGGEAPPGSEGELFEGGVNRRTANFGRYQFNADGEVLFTGTVYSPNSTIVLFYWHGLWKGTAGSYSLLTGAPGTPFAAKTPPPPGVTVPTYSGSGRLQFSVSEFRPLGVSDLGPGYFGADIDALEGPPGGFQQWRNVVKSGTLTASFGRQLLFYNGGPAPGLGGDYVFFDTGGPILGQMGQKNGALVMTSSVHPRDAVQPTASLRKVFYEYQNNSLRPFYIETDPLPGLPPLSELLGVTQPYDLRARVEAVDEMGNCVLYVTASARTFIDVRQIGYWKKTAAGLAKVLQFNVDVPTGVNGMARFGTTGTNVIQRVAMGGGNIAWIGSVTRAGSSAASPAIIREVENRFEVVAIRDLPVPGTPWTLVGDFTATNDWIRMNAPGEVLFSVSFREPPSTQLRRAVWAYGRDLVLRRVAYVGQEIAIGGATRTISNVEIEPPSVANVFNDSGVAVFKVTLQGGTSAILRAVPPGHKDPPPPVNAYWFNKSFGNWHDMPATNWQDEARRPRPQPPGDAHPNSATVFINSGQSVVLDRRSTPVGSVKAEGSLMLRQALTVNSDSTFQDLDVSGPNASLSVKDSTAEAGTVNWTSGTLALANARFRIRKEFKGTAGSVTNRGGTSALENQGVLRINGHGGFKLDVPFHSLDGGEIHIEQGSLDLLQGGSFSGRFAAIGRFATLSLVGAFTVAKDMNFESIRDAATLTLGNAQQDAQLALEPKAHLRFFVNRTVFNRGEIRGADASVSNHGVMDWKGGRVAVKSLANHHTLEIDSSNAPRRLSGSLVNRASTSSGYAKVIQLGAVEVDGEIENYDRWAIEKPTVISSSSGGGKFRNQGLLLIKLQEQGEVDIHTAFSNGQVHSDSAPAERSSTEVAAGTFFVGSSIETNFGMSRPEHARTTVRLRGDVENLQQGELRRGTWAVETGCTLIFPRPIETIGDFTFVELKGGEIPSLHLAKNKGKLVLYPSAFATPGSFENRGTVDLLGRSTLTVNGSLTNRRTLDCGNDSKILIAGDLNHMAGTLFNKGEIHFRGSASFRSAVFGAGKFIALGGGLLSFTHTGVFVFPPGSTTTVEGAVVLGEGASFSFELDENLQPRARSASDTPHRARAMATGTTLLSVTQSLTLGGVLQVNLKGDFQPAPADVFLLAEASTITGQFANVLTGQRVTTTNGRGSFQVFYGDGSPHGANSVVLTNWQPSPIGFPAISGFPAVHTIAAGDATVLRVTASGAGTLAYQWRYQGADIAGATNASYSVPSTQGDHAGSYSVVVTNSMGSVQSNITTLSVEPAPPSSSRLLNVSTRALIRDGNEPLIPGFVLEGTSTARLLIRAVGPTLGIFGVDGALPNPQITLKRLVGSAYIDHASNNDWSTNGNATEIAAAAASVGAFPLTVDALDSALLVDLAAGQYTVVANDVANRSGVGMVELYQVSNTAGSARLGNISTRAFVGAGADVMIPGFVVSNEGSRTVLVRAVGPTLSAFGVEGVLADPQLTIYQRQPDGTDIPVLSNNDWSTASDPANTAAVAAQVGAFALPAGSKDAALVATLSPGAYTVQASGVGGTTGNALVEVYVVP